MEKLITVLFCLFNLLVFVESRRIIIFTSNLNSNESMTEFLSTYDFGIDGVDIEVYKVQRT